MNQRFIGHFIEALRPGSYLRMIDDCNVGAGDEKAARLTEKHFKRSN
jgi:hypothetical protein